MSKECYTAYVSVDHKVINSFTDIYYSKAEKRAKEWVKKQGLKADILVEETTDKLMD